ncbi:MAG: RNA polymerase sporulation sigma factor SigH [bacterium]
MSKEKFNNFEDDINFIELKDEELVKLAQEENNINAQDFLINKYKNLVKIRSRTYFLAGAENEDVVQEGMIGLYKAIRDYKTSDAQFKTFARICIDRQVITAIKTANRKKHMPLNSYFSLNIAVSEENSDNVYMDLLEDSKVLNPEQLLIDKENVKNLKDKINNLLSDFEKNVLKLYLKGKNYSAIAENLQKDEKSIDNAIQRIRNKISKSLS